MLLLFYLFVLEAKEFFQTILRKHENDPKLEVTSCADEAGSKIGDNYLSVVIRTTINGKSGNGKSLYFMQKIANYFLIWKI